MMYYSNSNRRFALKPSSLRKISCARKPEACATIFLCSVIPAKAGIQITQQLLLFFKIICAVESQIRRLACPPSQWRAGRVEPRRGDMLIVYNF